MLNNVLYCGICKKIMEDKDRYFPSGSLSPADINLSVFCEGHFHWECFINWEKRNGYAKELSDLILNNEEKSSIYAKVYNDNDFYILVSLRTSNYKVRIIAVEIGIVIEVELDKWTNWVDKFQYIKEYNCYEVNVFTKLIPILIKHFSTKEDIERAVDWEKKKKIKEEFIRRLEEGSQKAEVERLNKVRIYNSRVKEIYNNNLKCPRCRGINIRLLDRSPENESAFICRSCCRSFRIEDLEL